MESILEYILFFFKFYIKGFDNYFLNVKKIKMYIKILHFKLWRDDFNVAISEFNFM